MNARSKILDHPGVLATADGEIAALLDEHRAEVLREAKREVVAWLTKKAREYRSTKSHQHRLQADAIETMASKVDRGAVRLFLDAAGKDTREGESTRDAETCGRCSRPFDPTDMRFDGRARYRDTRFCRGCVDICHESTDPFHRCLVCAALAPGGGDDRG
ncbi:hypothetical protein QOM21_24045 [Streptomyces sp. Pv4-95]|uniref:hypothetical protein n=1 Tax=Streptomyces sp. Pv4-95 TaxID=3049543 RepID=UPI003892AF3F